MCICSYKMPPNLFLKLTFIKNITLKNITLILKELEKVFKKKHSCGFIFSKLCHTPIFLIHVNIFSIK